MNSGNDHSTDTAARAAFIHREILQVSALILLAAAGFALTRSLAAGSRETSLRDAAEWYRRGQIQIEAGQVDGAVAAFRKATVRDRGERRYVLALAGALTLDGDVAEARRSLLALREEAPEDVDVNLQLARLAAGRQDVTEAVRFYRSALYAPWPGDAIAARRQLRFELIRFLVAHRQEAGALSELVAISADLPEDADIRVEAGQLFAQAGDQNHALDQFQRALRLAPAHDRALAGAGEAAFELGDYLLARTYLRQVRGAAAGVNQTRELVDLVLASDPLASRIGASERRRRLVAGLSQAEGRLNVCIEQRADPAASSVESALQQEARAFDAELQRLRSLDQDVVETGVDLIDRLEQQAEGCGAPAPIDRALRLIGRRHAGAGR